MVSPTRHSRWLACALAAFAGIPQTWADQEPLVREFEGKPVVRILGASTRFRFDGGDGVELWLDAESLGALALADALAHLPAAVAESRLPMPPAGSDGGPGTLRADWEPAEHRLVLRLGTLLLTTVQFPPGVVPQRILLRHLDRVALLALPPTGGAAVWVWSGSLRFVILVPDAEQYLLCTLTEVRCGDQQVDKSALLHGIAVSRLTEAGDVFVTGRSPWGEPFRHRHRISAADLDERVQRALAALSRTFKLDASMSRSAP